MFIYLHTRTYLQYLHTPKHINVLYIFAYQHTHLHKTIGCREEIQEVPYLATHQVQYTV